jgi:hypothetical protein
VLWSQDMSRACECERERAIWTGPGEVPPPVPGKADVGPVAQDRILYRGPYSQACTSPARRRAQFSSSISPRMSSGFHK